MSYRPTKTLLAYAPLLDEWRITKNAAGDDVLVGRCYAWSKAPDGSSVETAPLLRHDPVEGWAVTYSSLWRLGKPAEGVTQ